MARIAFITPEFITEQPTSGGLGNYLNRITRTLSDMGHQPEVFVASDHKAEIIDFNGVLVHRVNIFKADNFIFKVINFILFRLFKDLWAGPSGYLNYAWYLSSALKKREREVRFDFIQSTNCKASGLLINKSKKRPHVVRLSSKRDLLFDVDGRSGLGCRLMVYMEKHLIKKADIAYSPSRFIAEQCKKQWKMDIAVLKPPVFIEETAEGALPFTLPDRFLLHFGIITRRKGSVVLAKALNIVWEQEPEVQMVWCGLSNDDHVRNECLAILGENAQKLIWLGPQKKEYLYAVIKKAAATVLPSLADNLPNTVIESLLMETPVVGTRNSSIDELVEDRITGLLVSNNSEEDLSNAIIKVWRNEVVFNFSNIKNHTVFKKMEPLTATKNLIDFNFEYINDKI